eukprot:TRINITY_DN14046_c0_g1_i1.p2 TRINITY_DN14046_c0_g1~~TRINITY_DN14046_c0_g1_i1.p2  ORF type:complete len:192 (-),score=12.04 TRINITY_DN14046_c0_g1_i1:198-773(-)
MSFIANKGCFSQGILGNQLRSTRISKTALYSSSHRAMPPATTVRGPGPAERLSAAKHGTATAFSNNLPPLPCFSSASNLASLSVGLILFSISTKTWPSLLRSCEAAALARTNNPNKAGAGTNGTPEEPKAASGLSTCLQQLRPIFFEGIDETERGGLRNNVVNLDDGFLEPEVLLTDKGLAEKDRAILVVS